MSSNVTPFKRETDIDKLLADIKRDNPDAIIVVGLTDDNTSIYAIGSDFELIGAMEFAKMTILMGE